MLLPPLLGLPGGLPERCSLAGRLPVLRAFALGAGSVALLDSRARRRGQQRWLYANDRRRCTDSLLAANAAAFALQLLSRGALLGWGAKVNSLIAAGQLWRLATPALLHGDLLHLLVNCYSLHQVGPAAERLLGPQRFLSLYAFSAVTGNLASYALCPAPGVGASGAIFGLVASMAVYYARHRELYGRAGELQLESLSRVMLLNLLMGAMSKNIDNWAHAGGLVGGALFTATLGPNHNVGRRPLQPRLVQRW